MKQQLWSSKEIGQWLKQEQKEQELGLQEVIDTVVAESKSLVGCQQHPLWSSLDQIRNDAWQILSR